MSIENIVPKDWSAKLSRLSITTKSKLRGQHKGSHRSQRFGASLDFSDFREYAPGDDVRQIDWNVFARTDKYFIKRFLDEQEMRVHILLDTTKSMSDSVKWTFAKQLAASLGILVLQRDDRLSFSAVNEGKKPHFRRKGATYRKAFIQTISDIPEPTMSSSFTDNALPFLPKDSTVLFVITDCLESIESWQRFLQKLPKFAGDIRILQVVTYEEIDPTYGGDIQLVDVETSEQVNVSMSTRVLDAYHLERKKHQQQIELLCHKFGIRLLQVNADEGISHTMFHQLLRANWVQ
ncbi:Protein of unknown function DUF58 [Psychrobacillus sp. OK028]|uniref:DUF58 domain-containing protein n=1 Tax=Psychrobacillus sp. OK028 TaxID=1884359 RepID=UPI00088E812D|nr:DUF58 domain-containing protein [Psychrobacillus sp. OK028]SDM48657.1 Protein of unknown function DUF58 [Psychrobacillus sp. OK028]